ncbi:uncharacterized protein LOC144127950 [Amblyomma americanum]
MGTYASIAAALHVVYHMKECLPPGSLMIIVPVLLSLILTRRRRTQESSRPASPMACCTFVTPSRDDVRWDRSRTEEDAAIGPPLVPTEKRELEDSRRAQRCSLHKLDRHRPRRNKKEPTRTGSSGNHGASGCQEQRRPQSAPAGEWLASCDEGKDSRLPSTDALGNGFHGRPGHGSSASQESVEVARRQCDDDDEEKVLITDLSWNSFDVTDESHPSGTADSWPMGIKTHFPERMSAMPAEPHAVAEADGEELSDRHCRDHCLTAVAKPEVGTTAETFGGRELDELLQLCGQKRPATFSDLLQELGVDKCVKLRERDGEEIFRVSTGRGDSLLTVLHDDYLTRHWKRTLDDIMAHSGPSPEVTADSFNNDAGWDDIRKCYCVRDKYSEVLNKACINYFYLKGCTKFGEDERAMILPYMVVLKPLPGQTSNYL